jgi:hypothetical protein
MMRGFYNNNNMMFAAVVSAVVILALAADATKMETWLTGGPQAYRKGDR